VAPKVCPERIPEELKAAPRWVVWRYRFVDGKWEKVPISCHTRKAADINDPASWSGFQEAVRCYHDYGLDGIGFVVTAATPFSGVDLDGCRDPDSGALLPWAGETVQRLASYTEVTPSGTGVRTIVRGKLPSCSGARKGDVEVYSTGHYLTVTGAHLHGTPLAVEDRQGELGLLDAWLADKERRSDEEIIHGAMKGMPFRRLWEGDTAEYESHSEADLALCGMLVRWLGHRADAGRLERLFSQSELARRKKWKRDDYREMTLQKALAHRPGPFGDPLLTRTNQSTRIKQDEPGLLITPGCRLREDDTAPELLEKAVQTARALAETHGEEPDWQAMFILARKLRLLVSGGAGRPDPFQAAVLAYCERLGQPAEDYWNTFRICWDKAKLAEGESVLDWAANMARERPYMPAGPLREKYAFVASLAWHLADFRGTKPFWLPLRPIASLLKTNVMSVSRVIDLLEKDRIIRCVKEDYSYTKKKAKEYIFIGPPPASESGAAARGQPFGLRHRVFPRSTPI
jgi:hypothetical protein